jgi:hypothetical protein
MNTLLHDLKRFIAMRGWLVRASLLLLAGLLILPAAAQFNGSENSVFISGQIVNDANGAPIADHDIFIVSDSATNNGFQHYAIVKTDVNGFYRDTVLTHLNDGSLRIYLYDFSNNLEEATRYYRFTWSDEFQMIVDFDIYDPNATQSLQANFRPEKDTLTGNELSVIFRDMTTGYKIKSWWWDFGDGTYSDMQDPTHVFPEPGMYMVSLTVSAFPSSYEYYKTSTIVKQVQVAPIEFYHLGGHVFTGLYPPIDLGLAYLYMVTEDDQFIAIDTAVIDTLGYYYFYQLIEGKYTTKARLHEESAYYGQFIPTYFGNTLIWEESEEVTLGPTNWECNINLIQSEGIPSGNGRIDGQMMYDTSQVNSPLMPAGDVEVVLLGVEGAHITCKVSDLQGDFQFSNLAFGTYQLYPDVAGVPTAAMYITISENKPVADDFSLVISEEEVTYLAIGEPESPVGQVSSLYPNPARDQLKVSIGMKNQADVTVMIVDAAGRCIQRSDQALREGNTDLSLDVSQLRAGFYQVVILTGGSPAYTGKFLKSN